MRLRKHMAALALACAAAAPGVTLAQSAPRAVQVTPSQPEAKPDQKPQEKPDAKPEAAPDPKFAERRADTRPPLDEQQRAFELYRAHFGGELTKGTYLGVSTSAVPAALRQHLGLSEGVGLVVDFVEPEGPAQAAGLKQYDILTKFDDQILVNAQQLAVLVRSRKADDQVKLTLIRGGKEQTLTAKLVEKPVKPIQDMFGEWAAPDFNLQRNQFDALERLRERRAREAERGNRRNPDARAPENANPNLNLNVQGERVMAVWRDTGMTLTLNKLPGDKGRHLVVTDKSGKVLFDGNLDDEKDRQRLPKNIEDKVRQMESKLPPDGGEGAQGRFDSGSADVHFEGRVDFDPFEEKKPGPHDDPAAKGDAPGNPAANAPIGDNDVLYIAISNVHGPGVRTEKTGRVRDGRVRLPYVEPIECAGLTAKELEKQIASAYARSKVAHDVTVRVRKVVPENSREPAQR